MNSSDSELFRFLEDDLSTAGRVHTGCEDHVDVIARAAELANSEWSEDEAGAELALLADAEELHAAQTQLLTALVACPFTDVRGIRMSRILWNALKH